MKSKILAAVLLFAFTGVAQATTINLNNTEVPTISNQDVVTNQWNGFGLGIQNAYWYVDSRDPFDTMGLSNNPPFETSPIGRIDFLNGPVSNLSVDWWTIDPNTIFIDVYDSSNTLLRSFNGNGSGTQRLGSDISYLTWHDTGGFVQVSTLNFDQQTSPVPEPSTLLLLGSGLLAGAIARRKLTA